MLERPIVVFINPPNTGSISDDFGKERVTNGVEHTDWGNFPHLGILTLASYLEANSPFRTVYIDGVICPPEEIAQFMDANRSNIFAVCVSAITANFGSAVQICRHAKNINPEIVTVMGNDHFSALSHAVLSQNEVIDYGFSGNEVLGSLARFLTDLNDKTASNLSAYPGLVYRDTTEVIHVPVGKEAIFTGIDYSIIDRDYPHTATYAENFQKRLGKKLRDLLGRDVKMGMPVEFARGCIKFSGNDACSFCSIQYGGMWRNQVEASAQAWGLIKKAVDAGYDYLYVTADELPLTFPKLLLHMAQNRPSWHTALEENERPVLVGYARADGLQKENIVAAMREIGFRICYVGIDAGAPISLMAMNKPLRSHDPKHRAEKLFETNQEAIINAHKHDIALKIGFVLGHIGMTQELLEENVGSICRLLDTDAKSLVSIDVELLSPEPGSKEFQRLTQPSIADQFAEAHGLILADRRVRHAIAEKYSGKDIFDRDAAIADYVTAFMPELRFEDLVAARKRIRGHARTRGIVVGDG